MMYIVNIVLIVQNQFIKTSILYYFIGANLTRKRFGMSDKKVGDENMKLK